MDPKTPEVTGEPSAAPINQSNAKLHVGVNAKSGGQLWRMNNIGCYYSTDTGYREPKQLLTECQSTIRDLLVNHPELVEAKLVKEYETATCYAARSVGALIQILALRGWTFIAVTETGTGSPATTKFTLFFEREALTP